MTELAEAVIDDLARRTPHVVRLAQLASIAARIEPELIRTLRLKLMPGVETGVEADLCFSPLVQSYSTHAVVFSAAVTEVLRQRLARPDDPISLQNAYEVVARVHAGASSAIQLE